MNVRQVLEYTFAVNLSKKAQQNTHYTLSVG